MPSAVGTTGLTAAGRAEPARDRSDIGVPGAFSAASHDVTSLGEKSETGSWGSDGEFSSSSPHDVTSLGEKSEADSGGSDGEGSPPHLHRGPASSSLDPLHTHPSTCRRVGRAFGFESLGGGVDLDV